MKEKSEINNENRQKRKTSTSETNNQPILIPPNHKILQAYDLLRTN